MQSNQTTSESKPGSMGVFKYELLLLLMAMIWGSAFVAQQIGMEKGLGPMTFNGLRFGLGCLSLTNAFEPEGAE
jgi:drug/metabolite transporter (DMT)-like permease